MEKLFENIYEHKPSLIRRPISLTFHCPIFFLSIPIHFQLMIKNANKKIKWTNQLAVYKHTT